MKIQEIEISKLIPATYNPRKDLKPSDEEYQKIKKSILEFGFVSPLVVNEDMTVIGGHQRLKVLQELGYTEVECIIVNLDKTKEKALNIALNKISGEWDTEKLENLLNELLQEDFDVSITGFNSEEIDDLLNEYLDTEEDNFDIDEAINEIEEPITKQGDIWILGNHRLMCGDSTSDKDVSKLMGGNLADLVITDPPYNVDIENSQGMRIQNDNMSNSAFNEFLTKSFKCMNEFLKPGGAFYIWFASREHINFESALNNNKLEVRQELIWNKNALVLGSQDYQWKHEPCLYGWKSGGSHYFIDDRTQTTIIDNVKTDFNKMKKEELVKILEDIVSKINTTVINENKPTVNDLHPTMKPIKLLGRLIKNSSRINEKILDLFGGSGSTLIAAEQSKRVCYMMELDPKYCDVIVKRWEKLTNKKATLDDR